MRYLNWIVLCYHLDPILIPSCDNLVYANNILSSEGKRAIVCIQNGVTRVGGGQFLSELDPYAIVHIDGENSRMLKAIISIFS